MAGTESLPTPQDTNQNFALIGVQGTAGTADTRGTSVTMPISVDPDTGAMNVKDLSGAAGTTNVQVLGGTLQLGTITGNIGTVSMLSAGTVSMINAGTITSSGTTTGVGVVSMLSAGTVSMINAGTLTSLGTVPGVGVVTTVTNLSNGSVRMTVGTITTGTIVNSGTTTGVGVVTSVTNLASGTLLSSGTTTGVGVVTSVTNLASGTLLSSGTTTGVGVVTSLTQGSINVTAGTITAGTFSLNPLAGSVLTTLVAMGTAGTAAIPTTALSGRKALIAYNSGTTTVYIGGSGVSTASGIPIPINSYTPSFDLGTGVLYGIGGGGTLTALEIS